MQRGKYISPNIQNDYSDRQILLILLIRQIFADSNERIEVLLCHKPQQSPVLDAFPTYVFSCYNVVAVSIKRKTKTNVNVLVNRTAERQYLHAGSW